MPTDAELTAPAPFPLRAHLLVAVLLALLAWTAHATALDHLLAQAAFDRVQQTFPARDWRLLGLLGHQLAKSAVWIVWFVLFAASIASLRLASLAPRRRVLWTTTAAMAAGPALVSTLKLYTGPRCPWDLAEFGGHAVATSDWLVPSAEAGRCFPGGHASGGFSLLAIYFAGVMLADPKLQLAGLVAGLGAGFVFSAVRMVQGAHFLSHNLWSAFFVWTGAMVIFALAHPKAQPAFAASATRPA
jgi:membrane-associated PAP2 superfamily phosphatase